MAAANKFLGQFDLVGIPPAPRGIPQIEVTFDIDANGIMHVSAKDKGTGKEQSIQITGSSNLDSEEIERMRKEAEQHATEDKEQREHAELENTAETLVYQGKKQLKEFEAKIDAATKKKIEAELTALEDALQKKEYAALKTKIDAMNVALQEIGKKIYEWQAQQSPSSGAAKKKGKTGAHAEPEEEVVDAEFSEKDAGEA